jgi:hypothetical protein
MKRRASRPWRRGPSRRKRAVYFVLGAALGGLVGYGLVTAGPGSPPSLRAPSSVAWIGGLAAVCGLLSAWSPPAFWRQNRFRWRYGDEDRQLGDDDR